MFGYTRTELDAIVEKIGAYARKHDMQTLFKFVEQFPKVPADVEEGKVWEAILEREMVMGAIEGYIVGYAEGSGMDIDDMKREMGLSHQVTDSEVPPVTSRARKIDLDRETPGGGL